MTNMVKDHPELKLYECEMHRPGRFICKLGRVLAKDEEMAKEVAHCNWPMNVSSGVLVIREVKNAGRPLEFAK